MLPCIPVVPPGENDLACLAHGQLIQAMLVDLLMAYPQWCPRFDDFKRRYENSLCIARESRELPPEDFTNKLAELCGNEQLSETAKLNHVKVWEEARQGCQPIGGSPSEWQDILAGFIEICFPRTREEWLNLAVQANAENETRECIELITAMVIICLDHSDQAGYVALDIRSVPRESPTRAFADSMTLLTEYLALTELAWPDQYEVDNFAGLCQLSAGANESQHTTLAIMQMFHTSYQGVRDQRVRRENPFAFMAREKLSSPLRNSVLHPEINAEGELIVLRQLESGRLRRSQTRNDQTADHTSPGETDPEHQEQKVRSKVRTATVKDRDRETVRAAIEDYRSRFNGLTPGICALRKALKGKHVGQQKLTQILEEERQAGRYDIPRRK